MSTTCFVLLHVHVTVMMEVLNVAPDITGIEKKIDVKVSFLDFMYIQKPLQM